MAFLVFIIVAILVISAVITALVVYIVNKSINKDYYEEAEFGKTKEFNPNVFLDDDYTEEELSKLDHYEIDNGEEDNKITNKFNSDSTSKEELELLEKTSHDLKLDLDKYISNNDNNGEEEII